MGERERALIVWNSSAHFRGKYYRYAKNVLCLLSCHTAHILSSSMAFLVWPETGPRKGSVRSFVLIWCRAIPILWHLSYFIPHRGLLTMAGGQGRFMPPGAVHSKNWYNAQPEELVLSSALCPTSSGPHCEVKQHSFRAEPLKKQNKSVCCVKLQYSRLCSICVSPGVK